MPQLLKISTLTLCDGENPRSVIDFSSGIGGQWGNACEHVVSIEKDPVLARVHAAQTGMRVIDEYQLESIAPSVRRFSCFSGFYLPLRPRLASPGLVPHFHLGRIMRMSFCFVRQLATGEALEMLRLALENVAAILCHKHWRDIRNLVESVIAKCLAGLLYHPFCILKRIIQSARKHSSTLIDLTKFIPQKLEVARLIQPIDRNPTATVTILV